jgi:hypothetical protein
MVISILANSWWLSSCWPSWRIDVSVSTLGYGCRQFIKYYVHPIADSHMKEFVVAIERSMLFSAGDGDALVCHEPSWAIALEPYLSIF